MGYSKFISAVMCPWARWWVSWKMVEVLGNPVVRGEWVVAEAVFGLNEWRSHGEGTAAITWHVGCFPGDPRGKGGGRPVPFSGGCGNSMALASVYGSLISKFWCDASDVQKEWFTYVFHTSVPYFSCLSSWIVSFAGFSLLNLGEQQGSVLGVFFFSISALCIGDLSFVVFKYHFLYSDPSQIYIASLDLSPTSNCPLNLYNRYFDLNVSKTELIWLPKPIPLNSCSVHNPWNLLWYLSLFLFPQPFQFISTS